MAGVSVQSPIAVIFDGPIDPASVSDAISLTPPVSGSVAVVTLPDDRQATIEPTQSVPAAPSSGGTSENVLVFTPDAPLAAHTTYSVSLSSGVHRTDGEAASAQSWSFTTGEPVSNALNQIAYLSDRGGVANVWLMNPDGSNQREITAELVPVSGFDISGDGNILAYGAGGQVKVMKMDGTNPAVLTAPGDFEYAPTFTPDGTAPNRGAARRHRSGPWLLAHATGFRAGCEADSARWRARTRQRRAGGRWSGRIAGRAVVGSAGGPVRRWQHHARGPRSGQSGGAGRPHRGGLAAGTGLDGRLASGLG